MPMTLILPRPRVASPSERRLLARLGALDAEIDVLGEQRARVCASIAAERARQVETVGERRRLAAVRQVRQAQRRDR